MAVLDRLRQHPRRLAAERKSSTCCAFSIRQGSARLEAKQLERDGNLLQFERAVNEGTAGFLKTKPKALAHIAGAFRNTGLIEKVCHSELAVAAALGLVGGEWDPFFSQNPFLLMPLPPCRFCRRSEDGWSWCALHQWFLLLGGGLGI